MQQATSKPRTTYEQKAYFRILQTLLLAMNTAKDTSTRILNNFFFAAVEDSRTASVGRQKRRASNHPPVASTVIGLESGSGFKGPWYLDTSYVKRE